MKIKTKIGVFTAGVIVAKIYFRSPYDAIYNRVAGEMGVPFGLIKAIAEVESRHNASAHNTQGEDSRGLMQINANTAIALGVNPQNLNSLFDPETNVRTGAKLLKQLLDKYSLVEAISLYNFGERGGSSLKNKQLIRHSDGRFRNQLYLARVLGLMVLYSGLGA